MNRSAIHDWPAADTAMWDRLVAPASLLDEHGGLTGLRPSSLVNLRSGYGMWLRWLQECEPAALHEGPVARATVPRLKRWLDDRSDLRPITRLQYASATYRVLREAAPEHDWRGWQRLIGALRRAAGRGDTTRKAGRILDSGTLMRVGLEYAQSHDKVQPTELERAARFRTGAMIAMLALMPLRRRTFAELELGSSVFVEQDRIVVSASGTMMKCGIPWEAEVPDAILPIIREYINRVRPWLMAQWQEEHQILWVNDRGRPYDKGYLSNRIACTTKALLGVRISAHLFRDSAATTLARVDPSAAQLIAPLLAHTSLETAERHYIHAHSIDAGRTYAKVLRRQTRGRTE